MAEHTPRRRAAEVGIFPQSRFEPLVRAALFPQQAAAQWQLYLALRGDGPPDDGEARLYPFIARNLGYRLDEQPGRAALVDSQRRTTHANLTQCAAAAELVAAMRERGIGAVVLKGLALNARLYRRLDLRRSADIDVFAPPRFAAEIFALADAKGWTGKGRTRTLTRGMLAGFGATAFVAGDGSEFDIHWYPRREFAWDPELSRRFEADAREVTWRGVAWPVPSDTWLFMECIVHGIRHNDVAPIRWVVDAYTLASAADARIDWDFVLHCARSARLRPAFAAGLEVLADLGAPIPAAVLSALRTERAGALERFGYALSLHRPDLLRGVVPASVNYVLRAPGSMATRVAKVPAHLVQDMYDLPNRVRRRVGARPHRPD